MKPKANENVGEKVARLLRWLHKFRFMIFTTSDLCWIGDIPRSAAPRVARALRAKGISTVPRNSAVRDLLDTRTGKLVRERVWFIPTGKIKEDAELRSQLNTVARVRREYNWEREQFRSRAQSKHI